VSARRGRALDLSIARVGVDWAPSGKAVARVAAGVLAAERTRLARLSITFVGDADIARMNFRWFHKRRVTDVIAFALEDPLGTAGDVYIAPGVARRNAARLQVSATTEVLRLVIHGVLHVLGYDHPEGLSRVRSKMWRRQEALVERLVSAEAARRA